MSGCLIKRDVERRMPANFVRTRRDFVIWDSTLEKGLRVMNDLNALVVVFVYVFDLFLLVRRNLLSERSVAASGLTCGFFRRLALLPVGR